LKIVRFAGTSEAHLRSSQPNFFKNDSNPLYRELEGTSLRADCTQSSFTFAVSGKQRAEPRAQRPVPHEQLELLASNADCGTSRADYTTSGNFAAPVAEAERGRRREPELTGSNFDTKLQTTPKPTDREQHPLVLGATGSLTLLMYRRRDTSVRPALLYQPHLIHAHQKNTMHLEVSHWTSRVQGTKTVASDSTRKRLKNDVRNYVRNTSGPPLERQLYSVVECSCNRSSNM